MISMISDPITGASSAGWPFITDLLAMRIPYTENREPRNVKTAVFHWLLSKILDGAGDYNFILLRLGASRYC